MSMTRRQRRVRPILLVTLAFTALMMTTNSARAGTGDCSNLCFWSLPGFTGEPFFDGDPGAGCTTAAPAQSARNTTSETVDLFSDIGCVNLLDTLSPGESYSSPSVSIRSFRVHVPEPPPEEPPA